MQRKKLLCIYVLYSKLIIYNIFSIFFLLIMIKLVLQKKNELS